MARNGNKVSAPVQVKSIKKFVPTPEQIVMFEEYKLGELLQACVLGDLEKFRANLSSSARQLGILDAVEGSDAMLWACYAGKSDIIDEILKINSLKIDSTNHFGTNVLQMACEVGELEIAQKLYNRKPSLLKHKDKAGKTVMHYACNSKNLAIIEWIHGLDNKQLNRKSYDKETPLEYLLKIDSLVTEEVTNKILDLQAGTGQTLDQVLNSLSDDNSSSDDETESKERPTKRAAVAMSENSDTSVTSTTVGSQTPNILHHKKMFVQRARLEAEEQQAEDEVLPPPPPLRRILDTTQPHISEAQVHPASSVAVASTSMNNEGKKRKLTITIPAETVAKFRRNGEVTETQPVASTAVASSSGKSFLDGIKYNFFGSVKVGNLKAVQRAINRYPALLNSTHKDIGSIFHMACNYNQWNVIEWLLSQKPEFIDQRNKNFQIGYHLANAETQSKLDAYKQRIAQAVPAAAVASTVANPIADPVAAVASTSANPIVPQQQPVLPPPPVTQLTRDQLGGQILTDTYKGDVNAVSSALDKDPTFLNFVDIFGFTLSHNGHLDMAKELFRLNPNLLTSVYKIDRKEINAFDGVVKFCKDANKKGAMLKFLFDQNPQFFAESAAKLDAEYRKQIGIVLSNEVAQPVVIAPAPVQAQSSSLIDRVNALCDAVTNAAQIEFTTNVDLQRAINAGGIAVTLSGVQKFLTETSQMYLEKGVDFVAQGSIAAKVQNTEKAFKDMMSAINPNTNPALASYLGRI
jgi:hypothetical protein